MENGKITEVKLYPIELGQKLARCQKGCPVLNGSEETLQYLADLSKPYGTQIQIKDGVGYVVLK